MIWRNKQIDWVIFLVSCSSLAGKAGWPSVAAGWGLPTPGLCGHAVAGHLDCWENVGTQVTEGWLVVAIITRHEPCRLLPLGELEGELVFSSLHHHPCPEENDQGWVQQDAWADGEDSNQQQEEEGQPHGVVGGGEAVWWVNYEVDFDKRQNLLSICENNM